MPNHSKEGDLLQRLSEEAIEEVRTFAEHNLGWKVGARRIRSFRVLPKVWRAQAITVEIGRYLDQRLSDHPDEEVGVIFESQTILVYTANRGILRDLPYQFGIKDVCDVVYLETRRPSA